MAGTFNYDRYVNFSERDFICDPCFQDAVRNSNLENDEYWSTFLKVYPTKKDDVENARAFLRNLSFRQELPDQQLIERSLASHLKQIESFEATLGAKVRKLNVFKSALKVAAIFGGVVLLIYSIFYFGRGSQEILVQTEYGNVKSVLLPDSSMIVLNANSKIKYSRKWNESKTREVWLEGEAFFDVKHLNSNENEVRPREKFVVHIKDLDIEVLGTSFNIRSRRGKTEVVLQTGKIKVSFKTNASPNVLMKPNDIVVFNTDENKVTHSTTIADDYTAWKERKLILHNPTVNEITQYLEDNFGKKIILEKKEMGTKKIEGPILYDNLDDALFIISTVLRADILKEKNNTIIIRPR